MPCNTQQLIFAQYANNTAFTIEVYFELVRLLVRLLNKSRLA